MTAARRGQRAAFPQLRRPSSRNFPNGAVRPPSAHALTITVSATQCTPSVPPARQHPAGGAQDKRDYAVRGKVSPIRIETARTHVSSGALEGTEGSQWNG